MSRRPWTRDELIVAFNLYCKLRFGQCHGRNPQIIRLAKVLGRTANAVAMKLCNFASFDPSHQRRGVSGLGNVSGADKEIWKEFNADWNRLAVESERATRDLLGIKGVQMGEEQEQETAFERIDLGMPPGRTETQRLQNVRLGQAFFRSTILASYNDQCCICRLSCKALLTASHIIPWASRPDLRLDPRNGLCLCAMHDRAFDRGLVTLDSDFRMMVSRRLDSELSHPVINALFVVFCSQRIHLPEKFRPDAEHLDYHRTHIFQAV
jgi:predicted restriction endonuclease